MRCTVETACIAAGVLLIGSLAACGGDERNPTGPPGGGPGVDGGPRPDSGDPGGTPDASPVIPDAMTNAEGPLVEILSPTEPASGDYSSDAILTSSRFSVLCRVEFNPATGSAVDSSSVVITASNGENTNSFSALPSGEPGVYRASVSVEEFANGPVVLLCAASDTAQNPRINSDTITTYLDKGPEIRVLVPTSGDSFAEQVDILFSVIPDKVASDDDAGSAIDVASIELYISGTHIPGVTQTDGIHNVTVTFDDPVFPVPLVGQQSLRIVAANSRGTVREHIIEFRVDLDGPNIEVIAPDEGELVSEILRLQVQITDDVGVEPTSVVATIAGEHEFPLYPTGEGDEYLGTFDTRLLANMVFPTVIVRAQDQLGNQGSFGMILALDNVAPVVSLDSPPMREGIYVENKLYCSRVFDPLGEDAASDGQGLAQLSTLRARVEDRANTATTSSSIIIPKAGVAPETVALYILDDEEGALLVDSDGDGTCDEINPLLYPTSVPMVSDEVARIDLSAVPPNGDQHFEKRPDEGAVPFGPSPAPDSNCSDFQVASPEEPLCITQSLLRRVIEDASMTEPAIYAVPPIEQGPQCLGSAFDAVATNISDGWACVAVHAEDALGNIAVSPPLRVCIDADLDGAEGCPPVGAIAADPPPDCTGRYDPMTDTVDASQGCTIPSQDRFVAKEVRLVP